jgi:hypothetical protein
MKYNNNYSKYLIKSNPGSEYVYLLNERTIWFIDYILGVAFPTPINFEDKENGLCESGLQYKEFSDYLDFQNYLEEKTGGQEVSLESQVNPDTAWESNSIIKWITRYIVSN